MPREALRTQAHDARKISIHIVIDLSTWNPYLNILLLETIAAKLGIDYEAIHVKYENTLLHLAGE